MSSSGGRKKREDYKRCHRLYQYKEKEPQKAENDKAVREDMVKL